MSEGFCPRLVATDLDGTLLRSDRTVSPYTRHVLDRVRAAGIVVVPATARQVHGLTAIAAQAGFDWAVTSNGALVTNLATGEVAAETMLAPEILTMVIERLLDELPSLEFVSVADRGHTFRTTPAYPALAVWEDHNRDPATMQTVTLTELVDRPALKLAVRHPELRPDSYASLLADVAEVEATWSGTPLLEVSAAGATKAGGVAALAAHLGLDLADTVAYGDAANDIPMLLAAGLGVAMPDATADVIAIADAVAEYGHDRDGVGRHLERLFDL